MKKIYSIAFSLATLLFAVGCTQEALVENGGDIVIRLGVDGLDTKAPATGGELTVSSLDVYVFKADETTKLYYQHVSDPSSSLEDGKYVQSTNFAGMSNLTGSDSEKEAIVKAAKVYAIANYTGSLSGSETLAELKALAITDAQYREGGKVKADPVFVMTGESADGNAFASGGTDITVADITLKRVTTKMTVKVNFAASTITTSGTSKLLGDDIATTTTWEPMTGGSNFRVMLQNAVSGATLGGVAPTPSAAKAAGQLYSYGQQNMVADGGSGFVSPAFYTYPVQWTDAGDENAPFIKLVLPWKYTTKTDADKGGTPAGTVIDQNVVERYYKVILPGLTELESNTWYQPTVTLTVKPGEGNEPVLVEPDGMKVQPWGLVGGSDPSASPISDVAVTDAKFISLISDDLTVERGATASFDVIASGPVTMTLKNIYRTRFIKTTNPSNINQVGVDIDGNGGKKQDYIVLNGVENDYSYDYDGNGTPEDYHYSSWTDESGNTPKNWIKYTDGKLELLHKLTADLSSVDLAITPYVYEIRLTLNADASVYRDIKITQVPPIQVENVLSHGYVYINNQNNRTWTTDGTQKNITVNNKVYPTQIAKKSQGQRDYIGYLPSVDLHGTYKGGTYKYRYIVKVEPFDYESMITDAREGYSSSDDFFYAFTRIGDGIDYYSKMPKYKTGLPISGNSYDLIAKAAEVKYKGGSYSNSNYVSPEFMLASSYGAISGDMPFGNALLRCATYQEDGYPAGRWRLPTDAEIQFLVTLQNKGYIQQVFADGTWSSTGAIYFNSGFQRIPADGSGTLSSQGYTARCVYDTWYYGKAPVVSNTTYTVKVDK